MNAARSASPSALLGGHDDVVGHLPTTFAQQARWAVENVAVEGAASQFVRVGDEGMAITFRFCATCGATVFYDIDKMPGVIAVPVGASADPGFARPTYSVYGARKHAWVHVAEDIENMD